ncbi:DNA excision repair protein ERCC-1 isoform X1 [Oopsacas minuta]|uniref:DNA excision repair protein ERCC-1 n=1 Tax=Oopsacas minuta TaxID=111878 RepID=A0AAV7JC84_9METZ|nr:DNA excision repair protein ERCC-1 isoform X1 [Oopsacas minuta]
MAKLSTEVSTRSSRLLIHPCQRKNPLIPHIRDTPWEVSDVCPDFEVGERSCVLFLSVRYHSLHPEYIHERIGQEGMQKYNLKVLLVLIDMTNVKDILMELTQTVMRSDLTLVLSYGNSEAAKYIETYKRYEHKPPGLIMEKAETDFHKRAGECLTSVKSVNSTDSQTLLRHFGKMERVMKASKTELLACPGLGPTKATRLHTLFNKRITRKATQDIGENEEELLREYD